MSIDMNQAFKIVMYLESQGIRGSSISPKGFFQYHWNMPTYESELNYMREDDDVRLYTIKRDGDVWLRFRCLGSYDYGRFYQWSERYDLLKQEVIKEIYWEGCSSIIEPFQDGIPLLPIGTNFYFEVKNPGEDFTIVSEIALLDTLSRQELMAYKDANNHSVKLKHTNEKTYQITNINDWGYSPNKLVEC